MNLQYIKELFQNPLYVSILLYILVITIILYTKPTMFFDHNGNMKKTGCGENKVIFSLPMFIVVFSIVIYFLIKILKNNVN
jgi:hypothetical protein